MYIVFCKSCGSTGDDIISNAIMKMQDVEYAAGLLVNGLAATFYAN